VANYNIKVEYDKSFTLASTGERLSTTEENGRLTASITAKAVRDFAMIFSTKFQVLTASADGVQVNYYYYNDQTPETSLKTSKLAIETFSSLFGEYPYPVMNVAQANFCIGGMEFPNLVFIGDTIEEYETYQYVIVHEIAHQWWYGVVGNNQTAHSWLDEGLAEYSSALFFEKNKGYETTYESLVKRANTSMSVYQTVFETVYGENNDESMNRPLEEFKTETEYVYNAYIKGFLLYDSLASLLSEKVVVKCLKNYYQTYAFKIATPELLIASFEKTTSCNLEGMFDSWLKGKVVSS
jgi:aminopeptidase N